MTLALQGAQQLSSGLRLRVVAETATTITLGWDHVECDGFRFTHPSGRRSHTWDGTRTSVRFSKADGTYHVEPFTFGEECTFDWLED